jgi:hypothetical protein
MRFANMVQQIYRSFIIFTSYQRPTLVLAVPSIPFADSFDQGHRVP